MAEATTGEQGADETCATPKPQKEHDWLQRLIGDHWTPKSRAPGDDSAWFEFMTAHYHRKN